MSAVFRHSVAVVALGMSALLGSCAGGGATEGTAGPTPAAPVPTASPAPPPPAAPTRSIMEMSGPEDGGASAAVAASTTPAQTIATLPDPTTIPDSATGRENGDWAPELALIDLRNGKPWKLGDRVGPRAQGSVGAVVVSFSASWCGPCRMSLPFLKQLEDQHGDKLEVVIVSMDADDKGKREEVAAVAAAGLDAPVLEATEPVLTAWLGRRRNIPHLYILNRAGEILVQDRGFGDKVKKVLPGQVGYAMSHPDYVVRNKSR